MPDKFNMSLAPFDRLSKQEQQYLRSHLDVAYFRQADTILTPGKSGDSLFIMIKGIVEETDDDGKEVFAHYSTEDLFDVRSQIDGIVKHRYTALEDTLAYLLPKNIFIELYQSNPQFSGYFDNNLSKRQTLLDNAHKQQNLAEFMLTKVDNNIYNSPLLVAPNTSLQDVVEQMQQNNTDAAFVPLPSSEAFGIITRTDLLHALALQQKSLSSDVKAIAQTPVIAIEHGDYLFDAMISMTRHKCKRLAVTQSNAIVGILHLTQVLSAFSTHSHVLTLRIANANTIEELLLAASKQRELVQTLYKNGIRTRFIMELISAVNEQVIEKAFALIVPHHLHDHCCLLVLGSEGRGEQILKTDQDNALIVKDGLHWHQFGPLMDTFSQTLQQLGYPPCKGKVMVNNPEWVKSQLNWKKNIQFWVDQNTPQSVMNLAIMADAHAIAGNQALLSPVKQHLQQCMQQQSLLLMEFARPAVGFAVPLNLFGNVKHSKQGIDIKQGGIFPIVHGIRTLALEFGIPETNTFDRIDQLCQYNVLEQLTADNLSEALKLFIKWRLSQQISLNHSHNQLDVQQLNRTDRDLLRHSLHVVKKFKQWLRYHYQIRE
ncbi:DUF294 nucleotidyltransferase-like domain-containing protein [Vibrio casei]|uniref:Cyclic nucleotide-binding/CBS domain-containing protein n=1 Tax=Vibrio casei TaxID=673372 RepID=A0A368LHI7_9VIBR|nr:DUF294 nucleotidyltransferase-like domain-containing protein [Vibrio casei]RCS69240.1 cyclic nucleotide-binding/CBS domain-containing protein [Vibrio casei]SJN38050.1 Predicted signal-transduction protein containing cAMP-binding and CBS domains [Vibrio casei]